jgi:hypothetical protein
MTTIESLLHTHGPLLSGELAKKLANIESIPTNTASQRITRTKEILQIKGFFQSKQSLCYLPIHSIDDHLLSILSSAMFTSGRKYWYTLNALKMHEGIVSKKYLQCYTNYPVLPLAGHIPFDKVMGKFVTESILVYNDDDYLYSPQFSRHITNPLLHRTIELIKDSILTNFLSLARNTGLISYNSGELFGEFGKFQWAFKGLSPIIGLRSGKDFGYLLGDILFGKPFYKEDLLFFTEKLNHIQSFKNASRLLPIVLIDDLDPAALQHLKQQGVVVGFIRELFGSKYAEALKELVTVLNNAGASLINDPEKYLQLITELKKYNKGLLNNIRGTLFEFVVGHIHREDCQSINLGREIIENYNRHDMDVLAIYSNKVVVAECKALKRQIDSAEIVSWLHTKIPAFRSWLLRQETLKTKQMEFEYWSTSGFTADAIDKLDNASTETTKYKVTYYGPDTLRERAKQMGNKKLKEALDNYFLRTEV